MTANKPAILEVKVNNKWGSESTLKTIVKELVLIKLKQKNSYIISIPLHSSSDNVQHKNKIAFFNVCVLLLILCCVWCMSVCLYVSFKRVIPFFFLMTVKRYKTWRFSFTLQDISCKSSVSHLVFLYVLIL